MPVEVTREFVEVGRPNRPRTPLRPRSVTIHNTDNAGRGAGAKAHSRFVREQGFYIHKGEKKWVSWHYTVDDKHVIQQLPVNERAWHAGAGNAESIGIEICMNSDLDAAQAYRNAAALVATLVTDLELTPQDIVTHQSWTGKNCPSVLLVGDRWQQFLRAINDALQGRGLAESTLALDADETKAARTATPVEIDDSGNELDHDRLREAVDEFLGAGPERQ